MCKHCTHARTNLHNVTVVQKGKGKKTLTKQIKKRNDPVRHFLIFFFLTHKLSAQGFSETEARHQTRQCKDGVLSDEIFELSAFLI